MQVGFTHLIGRCQRCGAMVRKPLKWRAWCGGMMKIEDAEELMRCPCGGRIAQGTTWPWGGNLSYRGTQMNEKTGTGTGDLARPNVVFRWKVVVASRRGDDRGFERPMAFHRLVKENGDFNYNYFWREGESVGTANVGFDDDGRLYSTLISLSPLPGGSHEFVFCVVVAEGDQEHEYWNGKDTLALIPEEGDRDMIVGVTAALLQIMLDRFKPNIVYHNTIVENLPGKSLAKHLYLNSIFEENGYSITDGETRYGRRQWILEHVTPNSV